MNKNTKLGVRITCLILAIAMVAGLAYTFVYSIIAG